ncbi:MAG: HK97 family phage prohead protease [Rickettsiales bacterium]|nr:HK97 family phage prohead protease [Rickettsiales bacterium]
MKGEFVNGLSIGYTVNDCYFDKKNRRILTNINLKEISIVAFPANKHSNILYCKSNDTELKKANDIIDKLINVFNV